MALLGSTIIFSLLPCPSYAHTTRHDQAKKKNFVQSLAAYSIICYVLQIKDRHNGTQVALEPLQSISTSLLYFLVHTHTHAHTHSCTPCLVYISGMPPFPQNMSCFPTCLGREHLAGCVGPSCAHRLWVCVHQFTWWQRGLRVCALQADRRPRGGRFARHISSTLVTCLSSVRCSIAGRMWRITPRQFNAQLILVSVLDSPFVTHPSLRPSPSPHLFPLSALPPVLPLSSPCPPCLGDPQVMGGARSSLFQAFRKLCVRAFLALRRNREELFVLVEMMIGAYDVLFPPLHRHPHHLLLFCCLAVFPV